MLYKEKEIRLEEIIALMGEKLNTVKIFRLRTGREDTTWGKYRCR
jgi:hypothetical protein